MPKTISTEYDRYTVDFKRLAEALTLHPDILTSAHPETDNALINKGNQSK